MERGNFIIFDTNSSFLMHERGDCTLENDGFLLKMMVFYWNLTNCVLKTMISVWNNRTLRSRYHVCIYWFSIDFHYFLLIFTIFYWFLIDFHYFLLIFTIFYWFSIDFLLISIDFHYSGPYRCGAWRWIDHWPIWRCVLRLFLHWFVLFLYCFTLVLHCLVLFFC